MSMRKITNYKRTMIAFSLFSFVYLLVTSANADVVTNLKARYHQGQVFLTYKLVPGSDIQYRAYQSANPIASQIDLKQAQDLGYVLGDSGCNERYANVKAKKTKYLEICDTENEIRFKIPTKNGNSTEEVAEEYGLFVVTLNSSSPKYYAITTQVHGEDQDYAIKPGKNTLLSPIGGPVVKPQPVFQNNITTQPTFDNYVIYVTKTFNDFFPTMTTAGSYGYNFTVGYQDTTGSPKPLYINLHGGGGSFLDNQFFLSNDPDVAVINPDDYVPFTSSNIKKGSSTLWFGYHQTFDVFFGLDQKPETGMVMDYTLRRTNYLMDWATDDSDLGIDPDRIYVKGISAGGSGAWQTGLAYPEKIAAIRASKSTWIFIGGASGDEDKNKMFGAVSAKLPTNLTIHGYENIPYYDFVDAGYMLGTVYKNHSVPVLIALNGKKDKTVGWEPMIDLYDALEDSHHGGFFYFDMRSHEKEESDELRWTDDQVSGQTNDAGNGETLSSYQLNQPYPGFSNVSCDSNPGNGGAGNGDDYGTIHGFVDWMPDTVTKEGKNWSMYLLARNRTIGSANAKDILSPPNGLPCIVNVTIHRMPQNLQPKIDKIYQWTYSSSKGTQSGEVLYQGGDLMFTGIKLYKDPGKFTFGPKQ